MGRISLSLFRLISVGFLTALLVNQPVVAQSSSVERAVKATFLAKFTSYIDWPPRQLPPGGDIVVCVIGRDPFGSALEQAVAGEVSGGHSLVLRRFSSARDLDKCHLAYLGGSSRDVSSALSAANSTPVVTVTDFRNANVNGMIHFQLVGGSVRFDVDITKASQAGIGISSKLLGIARKVRRTSAK